MIGDLAAVPIGELLERRNFCKGAEVDRQLRRLSTSVYVYMENKNELEHMLKALSHPDSLELRAVKNRDKHHKVLRDVVRRLHNVVAAVKTLVDHSRRIVNDLSVSDTFMEQYSLKVSESFGIPEHTFVQKLRNYVLHYNLPPIVDTVHWKVGDIPGQGTIEMGITLDGATLLKWDKWNRQERALIASWKDGKAPLIEIVESYSQTVESFYRWLFDALVKMYKQDLQEYMAVKREIARRFSNTGEEEQEGDGSTIEL